ncbi:unnamed protein product, partial [Ectocarpus fasciculatus]
NRSDSTIGEKTDNVCDLDAIATEEKDAFSIAMVMKEKYVSMAEGELKDEDRESVPTHQECLKYILKEKLKGSTLAESTSDEVSWFNETDRLLQGIVSSEPGRGDGHGQMVVMRVYEKEEQNSMQHCLRQAMEKLEIHDGTPEKRLLFSVVSDNGDSNTSLSKTIEPYFLNKFNLLNAGAGEGTYTLKDRLAELQAGHDLRGGRRTASLSYADLLNVPMILILCDKGRTGDTFPHSLGCFDLRIRTAEQSFATFEQELGRLCRYQSFVPIDGGEVTECSRVQATALGEKAFCRKRVLKVSSPSSKFLGVANTWWELDEILSDNAQAHPKVRVEESAFRLPTMLITNKVMKKVHDAINEHRKTNTPISKCIRMGRMDQHMGGSMMKNVKVGDLHDYSRYQPGEGHYDFRRDKTSSRNERRLVLSAECQVGKTGAYLHYLKLLKRAASPIAVPPPPFPIVELSGDAVSWLLPRWQWLSGEDPLKAMYGRLFASKYTAGVANSRAYLVAQSCKREGWAVNFGKFLRNVSAHNVRGETITSEAGRKRIERLLTQRLDAPFDAKGQAVGTEASYASLKAAIDWDGRFRINHGVQLCVCSGYCTPACQDSVAQLKVSYGAALSIRMADLAETGGRLDGVIARWEADQDNNSHDDSQDPCELGDEFVAKQPSETWNKGHDSQTSGQPFKYREDSALELLLVSTPTSFKGGISELLRSKEKTRWIFTPSFNRFLPGPRQALLDRSESLPKPLDSLDEAPSATHFGGHYVIMQLPTFMPSDELPGSKCSPEEGGIGYTRHFIQRWSHANKIPFVWMLDDNVQLCHELDVGKEEAKYQPCSFTQVMSSLERLMLAENKKDIRVSTASDKEGTTRNVLEYVKVNGVREAACPPETDLLRGDTSQQPPATDREITTVGDLCGRPGHYGVLGISRHGYGCENNKEVEKPFGVTHSVYSFCLLNVASTVSKGAWYPMKRFWEDIEFNHIVDEKGLVVCMFRKFSHSKKNLQPIRPTRPLQSRPPPTRPPARRPLPDSRPEFWHNEIDLDELQRKYETGSNCLTDDLLKYLSEHVLQPIPIEEIFYPTGGGGVVTIDGRPFEIEPAAPMPGTRKLALEPRHDSHGSIIIMLLGGIRNESFGVLKHIIRDKVRVSYRNREQTEHGWGIKVKVTIVQDRAENMLLVLVFSSTADEPEEE